MTSPEAMTDVPFGWRASAFDALLSRVNTRGHKILASAYESSGAVPIVDQGQEAVAGFTNRPDLAIDPGEEGLIVFGDHTCHTKFVAVPFVVGADGTQVLRASEGNSARFLAYALEFRPVQSDGYNRHFGRLRERTFAVPPFDEQRRIAEALNDADDLISALARLIAKKEAVKQGMTQELLSGRTRLPGFTDNWTTSRLADVASMRSGGTPPSSESRFYGGGIPWVSVADMTRSGKTVTHTERTLTEDGLACCAAVRYEPDSVLYAIYASVGACSLAQGAVTSSQAILGISPSEALNREYLYYHLCSIRTAVLTRGQTGTQTNLNAAIVKDLVIPVPSRAEQDAIASVLSDADDELAVLRKRLEKTKAVKQGMMQELLTGRTRLPAESGQEAEAA